MWNNTNQINSSKIYQTTNGIGIGTTTVPEVLTVNGNLSASVFYDSNNKGYYVDPANSGTSILTAGKVGIGTTSPTQMLEVVGNATITNGSLYQTVYSNDESLIGYWPFSEGTGTTTYDRSMKGYDGTFTGAPVWTNGKYGNAILFDGIDDGIDIAETNFNTTYNYTMEAWIKPIGAHLHYTGTIISSGNWNIAHWALGVGQTNNYLEFRNPDGTTTYGGIQKTYNFALNQWNHVVVTRNIGTVKFYVNGNLIGTSSVGSTYPLNTTYSNTMIGRETYAGGYFAFNGSIDEVKVYKTALSDDEIRAHYIRGKTSGIIVSDEFKVLNSTYSELMRISTLGNVGIGTTTVPEKLTVNGNISGTVFYDANNKAYYVDPASTTILNIARITTLYNSSGQTFFSNTCTYGIASISAIGTVTCAAQQGSTSATVGGSGSSGYIAMWNATSQINSSKIYQTANGVGIGTTTVPEVLTVNGNTSATVFYDANNKGYYVDPANSGTSILTAGNVGIGTTTPSDKLNVIGNIKHTGNLISQGANYNSTWMQFDQDVNGNSVILGAGGLTAIGAGESASQVKANVAASTETLYLSSDNDIRFETSVQNGWATRIDAMTITTVGNVGIGTTSPSVKLDVYNATGNVIQYVRSGSGVTVQTVAQGSSYGWIGTSTNQDFYIGANNNGRIRILNNGDVAINTDDIYNVLSTGYVGIGTTVPGAKLEVVGSAKFSSAPVQFYGQVYFFNDTYLTNVETFDVNGSIVIRNIGGSVVGNWSDVAGTAKFYNKGDANITGTLDAADIKLTNLYDKDGSNFFDTSCTYGIASIDATGAFTCASQQAQGGVAGSGSSGYIAMWNGTNQINRSMIYQGASGVGIGTTTPGQKLVVVGDANVTNNIFYGGNLSGFGADFAERFTQAEIVETGDVVCLNDEMNIIKCSMHGQMSVTGVVSEKPTIIGNSQAENSVPVGIVGIVKTKVVGPIKRFDMLTTSNVKGYAEKASNDDMGAILGKAMEPCENEKCTIKVLIGLR